MKIDIVIPLHNEEGLLERTITRFLESFDMDSEPWLIYTFSVILVENGSTDSTWSICEKLSGKYKQIKPIKLSGKDYGMALRNGLLNSSGDYVFTIDMDLFNIEFVTNALEYLEKYDVVVGSKLNSMAEDNRPIIRRIISKTFCIFLKLFFGYNITTDTHGPKAYRREKVIEIVKKCKSDNSIFDTDLLLRAALEKLRITEMPIKVAEIRKTRFNNFERIFSSIRDIINLKFILIKEYQQ